MEKKGTLLGMLFGFFKDDLKDFCGGIAELCTETGITAVAGAGLAVASALLEGHHRGDEYLANPGKFAANPALFFQYPPYYRPPDQWSACGAPLWD